MLIKRWGWSSSIRSTLCFGCLKQWSTSSDTLLLVSVSVHEKGCTAQSEWHFQHLQNQYNITTPVRSNAIHYSGPTATVIPFKAANVQLWLLQLSNTVDWTLLYDIFSLYFTPLKAAPNSPQPYTLFVPAISRELNVDGRTEGTLCRIMQHKIKLWHSTNNTF